MLTSLFNASRSRKEAGLTLIELLVVIAIIGILAALLLPVLRRARDAALKTKCISNLREISIAIEMYKDDNGSRYPTNGGYNWVAAWIGGDDPNADSGSRFGLANATNRMLWQYTTSRELYRCPADRGMNFSPWMAPFENTFATIGTSYIYNTKPWALMREADRWSGDRGLAGRPDSCVIDPARRILFYEPPASPYWGDTGWLYFFWHSARGPNTVFSLSQAKDRFVSPVLFADGHAVSHDFTANIRANPAYPCEPTADWYWYEPAARTR